MMVASLKMVLVEVCKKVTTASKNALERLPIQIHSHAADASHAVAVKIAALIRERASQNRQCVLGLATGSTPVGIYNE